MKEMVKIVDNTAKHPEDKQYLICIAAKQGSGAQDSWNIVLGRSAAYEYIKENIDDIDFDLSFILVESCELSKRKSIYAFMKYAGDFFEDNFDIEDYIKGDWDENDFIRNNNISLIENENSNRVLAKVAIQNMDVENRNRRIYAKADLMPEINDERINMQSFLDGDIDTKDLN